LHNFPRLQEAILSSTFFFSVYLRPPHFIFEDYTGESILAQLMTTKEMAKYLKLHAITICKLSKEGKIPSIRIGRVWRFDKEVIDSWIAGDAGQ
jgi:excisionase family DNA binding protein